MIQSACILTTIRLGAAFGVNTALLVLRTTGRKSDQLKTDGPH